MQRYKFLGEAAKAPEIKYSNIIIFGARTPQQLKEMIEFIKAGPLLNKITGWVDAVREIFKMHSETTRTAI